MTKPAPSELSIALIGKRFMGRAHANAWGQANRFFELPRRARLATVAARETEGLAEFASRWGFERSTTDWRTIADDRSIDLVDVATPNGMHAEVALAMLAAGKHVACEKPLAATLPDARAMRDAARGRPSQRTFVWFNYRRCPAVALARELVREGRLGRIRHVRARYLQSWGGPSTPWSWRFDRARAGSGAHGDLNAHSIDLARFLVGEEIVEVHGAVARTFVAERTVTGTKDKRPSDVDDALLFLATFAGGALASFEASRVATGHHNGNSIEIDGEKGSVRFDFESMNELWFHDATDGAREAGWKRILATSVEGRHPYVAPWWPDGHVLGYEHGFANTAADVLRVMGGEEPETPLADFADAYETQRVLEAALLAARERCAVPLSAVQ